MFAAFREYSVVFALSGAFFFRMIGLMLVLPVSSTLVLQQPWGTPEKAGLVIGIAGLTQACLQIPLGRLSDLWGRKPVILLGLTMFCLGSLLASFTQSFIAVLIGRFFQGAAAISATVSAWITDSLAAETRAIGMLIFGAVVTAAFLIAIITSPLLAAQTGLSGIFITAATLGGISVLLVCFLPQTKITKQPAPAWTILRNRTLWFICLFAFCGHFGLGLFFTSIPHRIDLPLGEHWWLYLLSLGIAFAFATPLIAKAKRLGIFRVIVLAMAFVIVGYIGTLLSLSDWYLLIGGVSLFFCGFAILEAILPLAVSLVFESQNRGTAMGVMMSVEYAGIFFGAAVAGVIQGW